MSSEPLGDTREVALLTDFYSCDSMHADLRSFQTRVSGCCAREKNVVSQFEKVALYIFVFVLQLMVLIFNCVHSMDLVQTTGLIFEILCEAS